MKFIHCLILFLLTSTLVAQNDENVELQDSGPYSASLSAPPIHSGTEAFEVVLRVEFNEEVKVPQTVLSGVNLVFLDGTREVGQILNRREGVAEVAAGTIIRRTFEIDPGTALSDLDTSRYQELRISWPGLSDATAIMRVAPDQGDLVVADLDLRQTTVRLITVRGEIVIEFWPDVAPNHVRNFIQLSKDGFYNGSRFHRVLKDFVIQGGCPNTKPGARGRPGTGSPGYTVDAEFSDKPHLPGVISMARGNNPNSAGCQFFLVQGQHARNLDRAYSAFGKIRQGMDVLDELANTAVRPLNPADPRSEVSVPAEDLWLYAAVVEPVLKD